METYYIYLITNNINGKTYIGQRHLRKYKTKDVTPLTDGYMGSGKRIVNAENKYGVDNFTKEILATCHLSEIINILEIEYIRLYKAIGKAEYNIAEGGNTNSIKYLSDEEKLELRKKLKEKLNSPEIKKKLSESHKGKVSWNKGIPMSCGAKQKLKESLKNIDCVEKSKKAWKTIKSNGYSLSDIHKKMLLDSHLGKKQSPETIRKRVEKLRGKKRDDVSKEHLREAWRIRKESGWKPSNEMKKKISNSLKGRVSPTKGKHFSEETKKKISLSVTGEKNPFYGKHHSEETKKYLSDLGKNRKVSEETKKKISESMKKYREEKRNGTISKI